MEEVLGSSTNSSNSSSTRHRPMFVNQTSSAVSDRIGVVNEASENVNSTNDDNSDNNSERNLRREINRLRTVLHNSAIRRDVRTVVSFAPFLLIVVIKLIFDTFLLLLNVFLAFVCFHASNLALVLSIREKRVIRTFQSSLLSFLYIIFVNYFYGLDTILVPLRLLSNIAAPAAFFSVLYVVLITDFVAKLITIQLKALVASIPAKFLCSRRQRRFFQFVECTSQLYRYFLPIPQWSRYFNYRLFSLPSLNSDHIFATIYICYKIFLSRVVCIPWFESLKCLLRLTSVGERATLNEKDQAWQCTICFGDFLNPVKLSCGHIFCEECIGTWLDKEHTCPVCRATIALEDNTWKNGDTTFMPQIC